MLKNKLEQFISNVNGQFIEVSYKPAIFQCMDLAYLWVFVLGYPKATIQHEFAYEVYTKPGSLTKEYFDLIENTPDAIPQDGDLVVWSNKFGSAGHIGIALGGGNINSFKCFEQNSPLGTNANIRQRTYENILGWLRPKKDLSSGDVVSKEQIIIDLYKGIMDVDVSDDEKKWRLEQNLNPMELSKDILNGDDRAKDLWLKLWLSDKKVYETYCPKCPELPKDKDIPEKEGKQQSAYESAKENFIDWLKNLLHLA